MSIELNGNTFKTWQDVQSELFTPEEIAESNLRVALIGELIKSRKEKGLTQRQLEELSETGAIRRIAPVRVSCYFYGHRL